MQDLMKPCGKCGGTEKFLRQKGNQVGMYCMQCEAWFKWVGKKSLTEYARMGFRVHAESWVAPAMQMQEPIPNQQAKSSNGYSSRQDVQHVPSMATDRGYDDTQFPPTRLSSSDLGVKVPVGGTGDTPLGVEDYYAPSNEGVKSSDSLIDEDEPCEFCITRSMKAIHNDPYKLSIMGALASVSDLAGTKRFGTFKFKYCPSCGQKLKV